MSVSFPEINAAHIITQYPYTETDDYHVVVSELPNGIVHTRFINEDPLKSFVVRYPLIQLEEVAVLESFFISMRGRMGEFQFTDDAGNTYDHCRFDQDELSIKYNEPGSYSLEIALYVEQA